MSIELYRVSRVSWAVKTPIDEDLHGFDSIESASDFMEKLGVPSDEIDIAIVELAAQGHTRAQFGLDLRFIFSDNKRPDELIGVA